jgi:hypothetical protein
MPLEVRELVVKVNVGGSAAEAPRRLDEHDWAALKRELVEACLAEMRQRRAREEER